MWLKIWFGGLVKYISELMGNMLLLISQCAWGVNICLLCGMIWSIPCIGGSFMANGLMIIPRKCARYFLMLLPKRIRWSLLPRLLGLILVLMSSMIPGLRIIGWRVIDWLIRLCMLGGLLDKVWTLFFMPNLVLVDCLGLFLIWWPDGWLLIKILMFPIGDLIYMDILCSREYLNYLEVPFFIKLLKCLIGNQYQILVLLKTSMNMIIKLLKLY